MSTGKRSTLESILQAAKAEFLEKGFQEASLRNIVKTAGVTTGAFYGYFNSKEEMFDSLVKEAHDFLIERFKASVTAFEHLPTAEKPDHLGKESLEYIKESLPFIYEHMDEYTLLFECAEGTRYAHIKDEMIEIEVQCTHRCYDVLESLGYPRPKVDPLLEHIIITGTMNAYCELFLHKMPEEQSLKCIEDLNTFYTAGWSKIMGQS